MLCYVTYVTAFITVFIYLYDKFITENINVYMNNKMKNLSIIKV